MTNLIATLTGGAATAAFAWLMVTTEARPLLPLIELIIEIGGGA